MEHMIDVNFYPGFTRKAISFTIDDGNVVMDKKFLDILRPAGIKGTFNLCSHTADKMTPEAYREFYRGYEIANHCKYHPHAIRDEGKYLISEEPFDPGIKDHVELAAKKGIDAKILYRTEEEGLYQYNQYGRRYYVAEPDKYISLVKEGHAGLEEIFGKGSVKSFVWPFDKQDSEKLDTYFHNLDLDYYAVRRSGEWGAEEGFPLPKERIYWHYTARETNFLEKAAMFDAQPDDGTLKFFCMGVHSIDYERAGKWDELAVFAEKYGNRPTDYYYATVGDIFTYADALKKLIITPCCITNPSDRELYIKVDAKECIIPPGKTMAIA